MNLYFVHSHTRFVYFSCARDNLHGTDLSFYVYPYQLNVDDLIEKLYREVKLFLLPQTLSV